MSDPRDYVPSESLVRGIVDHALDDARGPCPARPWTRDALLHVAECESCQSVLDADVASRSGYDETLSWLPSEALVARVLASSARPRYRVRLLDDDAGARTTQRPFTRRAAGLLGALALSPAVLAAAVVAHVVVAVALADVTIFSVSAPQVQTIEHVQYVPVSAYRVSVPDERSRRSAERRALAVAVEQDVPVSSIMAGLRGAEVERLDSTVAQLRRNRGARVLIGADRSRDALSAAEVIGRYFIDRGVPRAQVKIVAGSASAGRVTVSLDTAARPR